MINYEELEDAALYGISESLECDLDSRESGHIDAENSEYQEEEIAEALYAQMMGWA